MKWLNLAAWLLMCLGVGAIGARWTAPEIHDWYRGLRKPSFNPPNWLFGPVWTLLYVLMGVAMWRVGSTKSSEIRSVGLVLFAVQLALNLAWSWIFFRRHALGTALVEMFLLWMSIAATMGVFALVDPIAAGLLIPYLGWVSYAFSLNAVIWRLNRSASSGGARYN